MDTTDELSLVSARLRFLEGQEFQAWKERNLDERAQAHLDRAVDAAKAMTPEGCFKAAHHLLLYASVRDMGDGEIARANVEKVILENPEITNPQ